MEQAISLSGAFRWVVACVEEASGVPVAKRQGLLPGQEEPDGEDESPRPIATGPRY
jgi:hypothetical protein